MTPSFRILALLVGVSVSPALAGPGEVYLVIGSDTAIWEGMSTSRYHNHYRLGLYTNPTNNAYRVMDPVFRSRFVDSYGQALKMTWWMMAGNIFRYADNTDVPVANIMTLYLMKKYHGEALRQHGDELTLHYHTFTWTDYDGDGKFYWNQATNFLECLEDFEFTLAQFLLEEEVFPVSFRSGWHYMDNDWQAHLDRLLPFSLHNDYAAKRSMTNEPIHNVFDWSQAPSSFIPYRPSPTNYQVPGDGRGWNVRSKFMGSMTQTLMNQIFAQAAGGTNQVACIWAHLPETNFLDNIAWVDSLAQIAATNYPTARFRYCTAIEAMQRWLGTPDGTPPGLDVSEEVQGETVTLTLRTDEPIFQPQPFVAVKDIFRGYQVVPCDPAGSNSWTVTLPVPHSQLAKVGIAATDPAGNLTTRLIRYVPAAPWDLKATPLDSSRIVLSWTDNSTDELGFQIERAASPGGPYLQIATLAANVTNYTNAGLAPSTIYHYRVRAYTAAASSDYSNVSSATTANSPPVLQPIGNRSATAGDTLTFTVTAFDAAPQSLVPLADFETYNVGTSQVLFRHPEVSTTTSGFLDAAATHYAVVTDAFPGAQGGDRVLRCTWAFTNGAVNQWLRLTTFQSSGVPNPVVDLRHGVRFDIYTEVTIKLGLGLRETVIPSGTSVVADGGTSGPIEWAGASGASGGTPNPTRTIAAGSWQSVQFHLPDEPITSFTGNGILSTASGLGVLEHLALVPLTSNDLNHTVYLDNFCVIYSNALSFSLEPGAPAGASINPLTGVFTWTPTYAQGPGDYPITVRVTDNGSPSLSDTETFVVSVNAAPRLLPIEDKTAVVSVPLTFTVATRDAGEGNSITLTDFENYSVGATEVLFRRPAYSNPTAGFVDAAAANYTTVTDTFPTHPGGNRVLKCAWAFTNGASNPWLRLTTHNAAGVPNPVVDFSRTLRFDIYTDKDLKVGIGLRETTNAVGTQIGSDGGTSGPIEWAGVSSVVSGTPNPTRTVAAGAWQTLAFALPTEPITRYTGDNVLFTESGLGVLEHLVFVPTAANIGACTVYLDNFAVVFPNTLIFSLDPGAPAGAGIDPVAGVFTWTPPSPGIYSITVRLTDSAATNSSETATFVVTVTPKIFCERIGESLALSWAGSSVLERATNVAGPYVELPGAVSPYVLNPAGEAQLYFRLRWSTNAPPG